jgi:hypothetical protein
MKRPTGLKLLGILNFVGVAWAALFAVFLLISPEKFVRAVDAVDHWTEPLGHSEFSLGVRVLFSAVAAAFATIGFSIARGFWNLKNWARVLMILACFFDVAEGGVPTIVDPLWRVLPANPWMDLLGRLLSIGVICYLQTAQIRFVFGRPPLNWQWRTTWALAIVLALGYPLAKSGAEFRAVLWHARRGSEYVVNGVRFSVPSWSSPDQHSDKCELNLWNERSPLRRRKDFWAISFNGYRESEKTVEQQVAEKIESYTRSGYSGMQRISLVAAEEPMQCVQEDFYTRTIYCFGDGPIYSAFYTGSSQGDEIFRQMLADAKSVSGQKPSR